MKTIKRGDEIKRVTDSSAIEFIKKGWEYCPKSLLKAAKKPKLDSKKEVEVKESLDKPRESKYQRKQREKHVGQKERRQIKHDKKGRKKG